MAHLRHFESFRQCAIFVDSFSRQSFTLGVISKWKLSALKLAIMAYFFSCIGYMSGIFFFLSLTVFKLVGYFIPDHGYSIGNSKLNWVKTRGKISTLIFR